MREGNIFTLCVSPHLDGGYPIHQQWRVPSSQFQMGGTPFQVQVGGGGGGTPFPGPGRGVTPSQVQVGGTIARFRQRGTLFPGPGGGIPFPGPGGTPIPGPGGGGNPSHGTPIQTWEGGTPHLDLGRGTPCLDQGRGTPHLDLERGYPPIQVRSQDRGGYPQLEQHSMYLLCSRRYASCIHAGGLSCSDAISIFCSNFKCFRRHCTSSFGFFVIRKSDAFLSDYLTDLKLHSTKYISLKNCPQWGLNP